MDPSSVIPAYQPLPFPLPVWLMQTLLIVGFYLHALPMNVIWGGGCLASVLFFLGRKDQTSYPFRTARILALSLPLFISFAITQGIVPLLFLQLLYGPAFYTSSIIMAVPWLSLVAVVLISYYLSYFVIYKVLGKEHTDKTGVTAAILLIVVAIGFGCVGYMFTSNITLMQTPEKWLAMYQSNSNGLNLNVKEPQLIARWSHFFFASLAVAGMTVGCFGLYVLKRDPDFGKWLIRIGCRIYLIVTCIQVPVGIWFLLSIPKQYARQFMGGDMLATTIFGVSMILTLAAIVCTAIASTTATVPGFLAGLVINAVLILAMIINRHQLRLFYLSPHLKPDAVPVSTQWDLLIIFLVSAVGLIWYLVWLSRLMLEAFRPPGPQTGDFTYARPENSVEQPQ